MFIFTIIVAILAVIAIFFFLAMRKGNLALSKRHEELEKGPEHNAMSRMRWDNALKDSKDKMRSGVTLGIVSMLAAFGLAGLTVLLLALSTIYTQDVGEAKVVRNLDGSLAGEDLTPGFGVKAPWQDVVDFDIRGQQANYKLDGTPTQPGEKVDGKEITVVDSQKIASNVDIAIRYSVKPDMVSEIYTVYRTQEVFFDRLISKDLQSVVREAANGFTTDELLTDKARYAKAIEDKLRSRWESQGVSIDSVALGNIRPPQSVTDRINASQQAAQQVITEQANTKVIEEQSRQKIIAAQGEADANRILSQSLTPEVLKQRELDTLSKFGEKGNGIVIQGGGTQPLLTIPAK